MNNLKEKAKTPFEIWQQTVEEALKNLPKAFNTGELSDEISKIRKRKEWIKMVDAQKEIEKQKDIYHVLWEKYSNLHDLFDTLMQISCEFYDDVQSERLELKHKLQQFKDLLSKENEPELHIGSANFTNIARFRIHMEKLRKKFKELLKEKIQKTKDNEIRLKVSKIRLDSLLRMPKGRRDETTIEKLREEITEIDEQLKKEA